MNTVKKRRLWKIGGNTEHHSSHFLSHTLHFLSGVCIFFTLATLASFSLYIIGNFQLFTERSQTMLLTISQYAGIIAFVVCLYYLIFLISWAISRARVPLGRIINVLLILLVNGGFTAAAIFIQAFTQGVALL